MATSEMTAASVILAGDGPALLTTPRAARLFLMAISGKLGAPRTDGDQSSAGLLYGPRATSRPGGKVAVLPLVGFLDQHPSELLEWLGGTATGVFGAAFDAAMADPAVRAVVLDVNSPGGSVFGTEELATKIAAARGTKPIIAVANSVAASAAYWIASAADKLYVTPGGLVGSIGVVVFREDATAIYDSMGVKVHVVAEGRYKAEGWPFVPMTEEERSHIQSQVGEIYERFVGNVATNRGTTPYQVQKTFGQGRESSAKQAKSVGMVDGIKTLEQVLAATVKAAGGTGARAEEPASYESLLLAVASEIGEEESCPIMDEEPAAGDPDAVELELDLRLRGLA